MSRAAKRLECLECGKAFGHKGDQTRHMVVHTKEKNYQCYKCEMAFGLKADLKQKEHLNKQMVVHTGARRFKFTI